MHYVILKSSLDGISGGTSRYTSIDEVLREIFDHRGWDSREQLHKAIRNWAEQDPHPGSVFCTQGTAIVAVGLACGIHANVECTECGHRGMDYGELAPVESGDIEQEVSCPQCGRRWQDVFVLADRREFFKLKRGPRTRPDVG
jgi:hypothetical protein